MGGALGVALAMVLPSVIGSLSVFYSLLGVSLFVPVIAGLYLARPGTPEALAAILGGVSLTAALRLGGYTGTGVWTANTLGLVTSAVLFGVVLLVRTRRMRRSLT